MNNKQLLLSNMTSFLYAGTVHIELNTHNCVFAAKGLSTANTPAYMRNICESKILHFLSQRYTERNTSQTD